MSASGLWGGMFHLLLFVKVLWNFYSNMFVAIIILEYGHIVRDQSCKMTSYSFISKLLYLALLLLDSVN